MIPSKERHREQSEQLRQAIQNTIRNLEPVLDEAAGESLLRIDSLSVELTLQSVDFERLEEILEKAVKKKILEVIEAQPMDVDQSSREMSEQISKDDSCREILTSFLNTGHLPWWVEPTGFADVEKWAADLSVKRWISFLKPLAKKKPIVIQRLVIQFSESLIESLIKKIVNEKFGDDQVIRLKNELLQFAKNQVISEAVHRQIKADLQSKIIESTLFERSMDQLIDEILTSVVAITVSLNSNKTNVQGVSEKLKNQLEKSENPKADSWLNRLNKNSDDKNRTVDRVAPDSFSQGGKIEESKTDSQQYYDEEGQNAIYSGVVIIHPFLESLFKNLGYVEDGKFLNDATRERAVCMVLFLATGEEEFPEYELLIPKFLCGWPIDLPISRYLKLTESEKKECESVLSSCIQHWEALKKTSIDGLRNNFLKREGILKREEFGWSLYIEQKTIDLLLDKLPWNLSIIKLKWMDEMLTVHWH